MEIGNEESNKKSEQEKGNLRGDMTKKNLRKENCRDEHKTSCKTTITKKKLGKCPQVSPLRHIASNWSVY